MTNWGGGLLDFATIAFRTELSHKMSHKIARSDFWVISLRSKKNSKFSRLSGHDDLT